MLRALLELSRVSNLPTVWTNVLAAWILASGPNWQWTPALGWLLLGASLIYSAGMILNDACDATWDRQHRPERPIPSGRIGLTTVWTIGLTWLLGGAALMVLAGGASWKITALLVAAIVAYDLYHKPWAGSVIIMGACRTLLYMTATVPSFLDWRARNYSMLDGTILELEVAVGGFCGSLMGIYIVALSLLARAEAKGGVGLAKRTVLTLLLVLPFALYGIDGATSASLAFASLWWIPHLLFIVWIVYALKYLSKGGPAIGQAVGLLLAGIPLVDAMAIANLAPSTALAFCALPPILRLWQRWVAAT